MYSWVFRKWLFLFFFIVYIPICMFIHVPVFNGVYALIARVLGGVMILSSAIMAWRIHSMYPPRHDRPEDFQELLVNRPYKYVKHPFYLMFIIMGYGIALFFPKYTWPSVKHLLNCYMV